jgi:hypothetical protein
VNSRWNADIAARLNSSNSSRVAGRSSIEDRRAYPVRRPSSSE